MLGVCTLVRLGLLILLGFYLFPVLRLCVPTYRKSNFPTNRSNTQKSCREIISALFWLIMSVPRGSIERQKEEEEDEENGNEEAEDYGETESDDDEEDESNGVDLEEDRRKRVMIRVGCGEGRLVSSSTAASSCSLSCQADECGLDLKLAKPYHKRHKVCERHANAAVVLVNGLRQRFCQQCSRFHEISEFDGTKKSCRERLAGHNLRRRKAHSDSQERLDRNNQRSE